MSRCQQLAGESTTLREEGGYRSRRATQPPGLPKTGMQASRPKSKSMSQKPSFRRTESAKSNCSSAIARSRSVRRRSDPKRITAATPTTQSFIPALSRMAAGRRGDIPAGGSDSVLTGEDIF